ncbi:hypothetical protein ACTFIV_005935 [Dictyostelium citrinum]
MAKQRTFFDVEIDGKPIGRIVFELFNDVAPKTTENFRVLCLGTQYSKITQTRLHYKGTPFHRIIKNFMVQCGDFQNKNGTGGESIYGKRFDDENFKIKHSEPYLLSMANAGPNTNGSQFFITTAPAPHLDGKHCVFGKVVSGQNVVDILNSLLTDQNDKPYADVKIVHCGELVLKSSTQNKKDNSDSDDSDNSDSDSSSSSSSSEDERKKRKKRKKRKEEKKRKSKDRKKRKKRSYSSSSDDSDYSDSDSDSDSDDDYKKKKKRRGRSRSKDRKSSSSSSSKRDRSRSGSIDELRDRYKPLSSSSSSRGYDKKSTSPNRQSDSSGRAVKGRGAVKYSQVRNGNNRYGRDYRDNRDSRNNNSDREYRDNNSRDIRNDDRYRDRYTYKNSRDEKDNESNYNKRKERFNDDNAQLDSSRNSARSYADIDYKDTYSENDLENIKITIKNDENKENERIYTRNNNNNTNNNDNNNNNNDNDEKEEGEHDEKNDSLKRKEETTTNSSNVVSSPLSSSLSKNDEKNINSSPFRKNRDDSDDDRRGRRRYRDDDDDDYSDD